MRELKDRFVIVIVIVTHNTQQATRVCDGPG